MTGNVKEVYDHINANGNTNVYPFIYINSENIEPSIRGKKNLYSFRSFFVKIVNYHYLW